MSRYISVGIDIGSSMVRVAVSEAQKNKSGFKIIGSGEAPSKGLKQGYIVNQNEAIKSIQKAVEMAEKKADIHIKSALLGIGSIGLGSETSKGSVIISRVDGEISENDVQKVLMESEKGLSLSNRKIIHRFPISFKIDGNKVFGDPEGMRGVKLEVETFFVTCLGQHIETLINTVEKAGVEIEDIVASPLSAHVITLNRAQRTAGCVLVNIGAETTSVGVFENELLIDLSVFPVGGNDITNDIALGLRITLEDADEIKKDLSSNRIPASQKKLDQIIVARLKDIFDFIEKDLKKIDRNELLPAGIILTGGSSEISGIEELAKLSLKIPANVAHLNLMGGLQNNVWSVAYGLCFLGMDDTYRSEIGEINTNIIKSGTKKILFWSRQFLP